MARKAKRGKTAQRPKAATPRKPKTDIEKKRDAHVEAQRAAWAKRHPRLAAQERALRVASAQQQANFGHKRNGTIETHAKAAIRREGALARLYTSGAIDADQLAAGEEIALVHGRITAPVSVRTGGLETRVDTSRHGDIFYEALGAVRLEVTYSSWRAELGPDAAVALSIIIDDIGIAEAARRHRVHVRRARAILIDALSLWGSRLQDACRSIDTAALLAKQAEIL